MKSSWDYKDYEVPVMILNEKETFPFIRLWNVDTRTWDVYLFKEFTSEGYSVYEYVLEGDLIEHPKQLPG